MFDKWNRSAEFRLGIHLFWIVILLSVGALLIRLISRPDKEVYYFQPIAGPLVNPLMGWAPWASLKKIEQPHTLVYADLSWKDFEPREGEYDFVTFEEDQQLARWRQEGKRVVFRFVADYPGSETHMDIPDWLFKKMGQTGVFYDNEYGQGFSPDYSNPLFIVHHELAILALAERYGNDGFFAYIELGSLGHWGEWHIHPDVGQMPLQDIRDIYVNHYKSAFGGTHLLMRRPFNIAHDLNLGLYNDMTGSPEATNEWLNWIAQGGDFYPEPNALAPMPDGWKVAPIGGEQVPVLRDEDVYGTDLEITLDLLEKSHTTFIGPEGGDDVPLGSELQSGIDQVMALIGYRLRLEWAEMPFVIWFKDKADIRLSFRNDGIAPFYYEWPVRMDLFDSQGDLVMMYEIPMDLRRILPGNSYEISFSFAVDKLENGWYTLGIAIIDPLTGEPGLILANENLRSDLIFEIGSLEIRRLFNR